MLVLSQAAPSRCTCPSSPSPSPSSSSSSSSSLRQSSLKPTPTLFSKRTNLNSKHTQFNWDPRFPLIISNSSSSSDNPSSSPLAKDRPSPSPSTYNNDTIFVGQDGVPLEGVIQFDKPSPSSSPVAKWGRIALLSGGDVLVLLMFAAIGRFSHGFPVLDVQTLRTADPFIAGWFLSAYFLGGYSEDGRGMNGSSKAVFAASKSWALGIPIGLGIRALTSGHFPPMNFTLVTLGSTAVLLIGWRALLFQILPNDRGKKDDVYRRGSPFELFELLTSLVRRW